MTPSTRQHWDATAEASVLGGILCRNDALRKLADLEVEDFRHPKHQAVFGAMRNLESRSEPIDSVTLRAELVRLGRWASLGAGQGPDAEANASAFLVELMLHVPSPDNVADYAEIIVRHRVTRTLVETLHDALDLINGADNVDCLGEDAVQWVGAEVGKIRTRGKDSTITIGQIVRERIREYDRIAIERESGQRALTGLPTGIAKLDAIMGGYQRGIVTTVCGRPAMGKSSGAMAAADACSDAGLGVHVFSLEDPRAMYGDRVVARMSEIPTTKLRKADFSQDEFHRFRGAVAKADARKCWKVDDRGGLTAPEIVRSWRRVGEKNDTKLVIVDLLQRIRPTDSRMKTYEHVTQVMHLFSDAAKADQIVLVLLAQLNREVERRDDKRPVMSDLQDAGTVEQDSKCILGYYRGAYYGPKPRPEIDYDEDGPPPSPEAFEATVQVCILKDSNGATGRVFARWNGPTTRIS